MEKSHYQKEKHFYIYALVLREEVDYVYVGKSAAKDLSHVFSRHICGNVAATDAYFTKESRPRLHVLAEYCETTARAYKHVVAYINVFMEAGYCCINHLATIRHAEEPMEETQKIIEQIKITPLNEILDSTYVARPSAVKWQNEEPENVTVFQEQNQTSQMNIRVKQEVKERFTAFCRNMGINQRQGFEMLNDYAQGVEVSETASVLLEHQNEINRLRAENERLQLSNEQLKKDCVPTSELWARNYLAFLQTGIRYYLSLLPKRSEEQQKLNHKSYKSYKSQFAGRKGCGYPEKEGFYKVTLEGVLWSNSGTKACFLVYTDDRGEQYKLRYYPKSYYLGWSFLDHTYAFVGARWVVGVRQAKDGAMEIVAGFPLAVTMDDEIEENTLTMSLAAKIAAAEEKRNNPSPK